MPPQSETTVRLLERRSNRAIADLSGLFRTCSWTERWRQCGSGQLSLAAEDFPDTAAPFLLEGNLSILIMRDWTDDRGRQYRERFSGPCTKMVHRDGGAISYTLDYSVANEIVLLGNGTGASRAVLRRFDADSQARIGTRELIDDARHLTTTDELEARGDALLAERTEPAGTMDMAPGTPAASPEIELHFADNLIYLDWRVVDTDGVATVDPGNVPAGEYIETLVADNLLSPTLGRRAVGVPATFVDATGIGAPVDLPVRWKRLADAVKDACIAGGVGITATLTHDHRIEYAVQPVRDRTSGSGNAAVLNPDYLGTEWDLRPGDRADVELFLHGGASAPYASAERLCVARAVRVEARQPNRVRLAWGSERSDLEALISERLNQTRPAELH